MSQENVATGLRSLTRRSGSVQPALPMRPFPWKTRIALPSAIVLAILAAVGWSARDVFLPATDVRVVPVVLRPSSSAAPSPAASTPQSDATGVIAQAAGWIEPDPYAVAVTALTDGIVREVLVLEGQRVAAGDVVARLVDDDAKLAVQRAEAALAASEAELTSARRHWEHPVERRRAATAARASLAETQAELAKLEDDIAAEQARVGELAELVTRTERMTSSRAASEQELIVLRFRLQAQQAVLRATEARRPMLTALIDQKMAEASAAEENANLRIEEARSLAAAKAAKMQAEVDLAEARLRLARMEVRTPAAGVVMNRLVEPGAKLMLGMDSPQSAYVARLFDPAKLQVRVDVPLADAAKVGVGTRAEITAEALPGQVLRGEVSRIVNEADLTKNTLQFKVRIIDPPEGLKPEMLARVKFLSTERAAASTGVIAHSGGVHLPFIPESLVTRNGSSATLTIADRGRRIAVRREVTLGTDTQNGWVAVTSGLSAGDAVIAEPAGVADGTRIRVMGEVHDAFAHAGERGGN